MLARWLGMRKVVIGESEAAVVVIWWWLLADILKMIDLTFLPQ